jgi:uncharacterized protein (DUF2236 family)
VADVRCSKKLDPVTAEQVYKEFGIMGTALQVPQEMWPKNRAAFRAYYADMLKNGLHVRPEAREVLSNLMHPKGIPLFLRPFVPLGVYTFKSIAAEQLPQALVLGEGPNGNSGFNIHQSRWDRLWVCLPPCHCSLLDANVW